MYINSPTFYLLLKHPQKLPLLPFVLLFGNTFALTATDSFDVLQLQEHELSLSESLSLFLRGQFEFIVNSSFSPPSHPLLLIVSKLPLSLSLSLFEQHRFMQNTFLSLLLLLPLFEFEQKQFSLLPPLSSSSRNILHIIWVITAVINANIANAIVTTKNIKFPIINVATKNIANIILATKKGQLKIFCNAIDIIITAIGKAKNISK